MEKKNYIAGVDIGSSNVVMVVGTRNSDDTLSIAGIESESAEGGVVSGRIENIRSVGDALRAAKNSIESDLGIRINEAYAGISGDFVRCAIYTDHVFIKEPTRCITKEDVAALHDRMRNVLAPDGEEILERIPQNYVVDDGSECDDPVGAFGRKLSSTFLFVLCNREQIERVRMSFHNAGMRLAGLCVNPAVLPDVLLSDLEREEGAAVVDIGGGTTDVSIVRGGKLRYFASIPIGASTIDADLHAFGIVRSHAEKIKKKYGSALSDKVPENAVVSMQMQGATKRDFLQINIVKVIEARLKDIAELVAKEINGAKFSKKIPCGIVLSGGSALLGDIAELFRRETHCDSVRLGPPLNGIDEESKEKIGTYSHSTAVAVLRFGASHGVYDVVEAPAGVAPVQRGTQGGRTQTAARVGYVGPGPDAGAGERVVSDNVAPKRVAPQPLASEPEESAGGEDKDGSIRVLPAGVGPGDEPPKNEGGILGRMANIFDRIFNKDNDDFL